MATTKAKVKKAKLAANISAKKVVKTVIKTGVRNKARLKAKAKPALRAKAPAKAKHLVQVKPKVSAASGPVGIKPYQLKKDEPYMNDKQVEHFRKILLKWKDQLMNEVDRTVQHLQTEAANYPDPVDRASQEEGFNLELRTRDRERKLLKKIEETLNRIEDKDYGFCDDCGAEIGVRRLEARPTATQCIECKTIAELREKQVGDGS